MEHVGYADNTRRGNVFLLAHERLVSLRTVADCCVWAAPADVIAESPDDAASEDSDGSLDELLGRREWRRERPGVKLPTKPLTIPAVFNFDHREEVRKLLEVMWRIVCVRRCAKGMMFVVPSSMCVGAAEGNLQEAGVGADPVLASGCGQ